MVLSRLRMQKLNVPTQAINQLTVETSEGPTSEGPTTHFCCFDV